MATPLVPTRTEARVLVICLCVVALVGSAEFVALASRSRSSSGFSVALMSPLLFSSAAIVGLVVTASRVLRRDRGSAGLIEVLDARWWRRVVAEQTGWPRGIVVPALVAVRVAGVVAILAIGIGFARHA